MQYEWIDIGEILNENGEPIAECVDEKIGTLLAAAPELLAALKQAREVIQHMGAFIASKKLGYNFEGPSEDMNEIDAAIAKAEGTTTNQPNSADYADEEKR